MKSVSPPGGDVSATKSLSPLDWTFLAGESHESMMHVGALMHFAPPPRPKRNFLRALMDEVRTETVAYAPWNLKLRRPEHPAHPLQAWIEDDLFDPEYHVRRSALPEPGDERELGILVSRLHSHALDFHRPPWEVHFIEGLEDGRFAIYFKVHHALVDGYTGIKLLSHSLSSKADDKSTPIFHARPPSPRGARDGNTAPTMEALLHAVREQLGATRNIAKAVLHVAKSVQRKDHHLVAPMQAPKSIINQRISRSRRFATQQFKVDRLKTVAKAHGGTINDIVLALSAGALRRLLREQDALPDQAMTAMLPVNIRPKDDPGGGNAVGAILASLATDIEDPVERFHSIIASTRNAKAELQGMTRNAIMQYSALLMTPLILSLVPAAIGRLRPAFNVVISNVPGPTQPLYFRGYRMESYYPLSIPFNGYGVNITVVSYLDTLNFGFIGCREALPHLQRLAVYSRETLEELEAATA
ncbi:wax ester/triacylglycerol synthase family O-acyltransferase [Sinimarinibacterium sp. CAU 1509]|nr:wax ester/triacylglycerol synthase family O-acyltransferase [Sinimarinibacterium sp. CAU 1509]